MKPIDYIYKNLDSFNISIFKQIVEESGEEVSESIYDYLMETTWNTNPALLKQFGLDIERSREDESGSGNEEKKKVVVVSDGAVITFDTINSDFSSYEEFISYVNSIADAGKELNILVTIGDEYEYPYIVSDDIHINNNSSLMVSDTLDYGRRRGLVFNISGIAFWHDDDE